MGRQENACIDCIKTAQEFLGWDFGKAAFWAGFFFFQTHAITDSEVCVMICICITRVEWEVLDGRLAGLW